MALKERRRRQVLETAAPLLIQGERIELTTTANVGTVSVRRQVLTAAVVGVLSAGTVMATVRPRAMYVVLTDQRLLFFDAATATRPALLTFAQRPSRVGRDGDRYGLICHF